MTTLQTCQLPPFLAQAVPVRDDIAALASAVQLTNQQLELYLRKLLETICDDLTACCGSTPVLDFTELGDVPHSYVGEGGKVVRVKATEDGLEFFTMTLVTTFLQLSDTPNTYTGSGLFFVRVNAGETALEFFDLTATLVTTFLGLSDTPNSYSGAALQYVRVNAGATALEFFDLTSTLVTTFLGLTDTPNSYSGQALKTVRVNAGETALEFHTELFTDLGDVPASYSGAAGAFVVVNSTGNGLEFTTGSGPQTPTIIAPGLTRTLFLPALAGAWQLIGVGTVSNNGTLTTQIPVTNTIIGSHYRMRSASAAGAGSSAGSRTQTTIVSRGSAAGCGGFRFAARWGTTTAVAQQRSFIGVTDQTTSIGNVNPSTLTNIFGVGYDSTETQLSFLYNDGSGSATKDSINGGVGFPVDSTTLYELVFTCSPNSSTIEFIIRNLSTGISVTGQKTTNLPANTVLLAPQIWANNGTTASAVQVEMLYILLAMYG